MILATLVLVAWTILAIKFSEADYRRARAGQK